MTDGNMTLTEDVSDGSQTWKEYFEGQLEDYHDWLPVPIMLVAVCMCGCLLKCWMCCCRSSKDSDTRDADFDDAFVVD